MKNYYFTSESVTEGHPDKLCDYISDSILDAFLKEDSNSRVACETVAGKGEIIVTGEITSKAENVNIEKIVREAIKDIGYDNAELDIDYRTCKIHINISKQSKDIAIGVDKSLEEKTDGDIVSEGAGDQGIMFGFACDETENLMPMPIFLAHGLSKRLTEVRKQNIINYLRPDGKVQVTIEYEEEKPVRVHTIVVSTQHDADIDLEVLKKDIKEKVIGEVVPKELLDKNTKYYINPTGRFVIGGPLGDSGLTGRKIIVDTYGGYSRHGGGAFSGKDATKVDRSASYMARNLAKNIVANGLAKKCEIQLSYAIGVARPISIYVETFGTATIPEDEIVEKIKNKFDLTPRGIINYLDLQKPIYRKTTNYGHFGKEELPWEKVVEL
jgi:S-adenosylmethionine synthetase